MKCPECDGAGYKKISATSCAICERCGGMGEVKETNFERITKSPEALAKWLEESIGSFCDTYYGDVDCGKCPIADDCDEIEQKRLKQLRDNSTDNISISDKDYWLAWLKQESK